MNNVCALKSTIEHFVDDQKRHVSWLLALSFLEHTGARKLARYEATQTMGMSLLQHVTEEFRHAEFLRRQALKLTDAMPEKLRAHDVIGGLATWYFIDRVEVGIVRLLKKNDVCNKQELNDAAYLLMTLVIEERASVIYPIYDQILKERRLAIRMAAIIAEETEHLGLMRKLLNEKPKLLGLVNEARAIENQCFNYWWQSWQN